jgi:hypothetical protein
MWGLGPVVSFSILAMHSVAWQLEMLPFEVMMEYIWEYPISHLNMLKWDISGI